MKTRPRKPPTLGQFIELRLGGETKVATQLKTMVVRSFGASSFREFWQYWNPVYGYYLYFYCYAPLHRILPRPISVVITFACSGFFLHDLPFGWWIRVLRTQSLPMPFVTVWFSILGLVAIIADALRLNFPRQPGALRVGLNITYIVLPFLFTLFLSSQVSR